MVYFIRLTEEAEDDLFAIYSYIADHASSAVARQYVNRIHDFLAGLDTFPERGTLRDEIRPGLRIVGFERRANVAFVIEGAEVVILRLLYAGRQFDIDS